MKNYVLARPIHDSFNLFSFFLLKSQPVHRSFSVLFFRLLFFPFLFFSFLSFPFLFRDAPVDRASTQEPARAAPTLNQKTILTELDNKARVHRDYYMVGCWFHSSKILLSGRNVLLSPCLIKKKDRMHSPALCPQTWDS